MLDGIILINKQRDITSYDVIRRLKRVLPKGQKIGHAGTLDPFAEGLLIILLGKATKKMNYIHSMQKQYIVTAEFGYCTDTQDCTGRKLQELDDLPIVSKEIIQDEISQKFLGEISQIPPIFSATKIHGRKAYEYARKGESVKLKEKVVTISSFNILNYEWPFVEFDVVCSTGTYVRTLIDDLGKSLRVYGTAVKLVRQRIGDFDLRDALDCAKISQDCVDVVIGNILTLDDAFNEER